MRKSVCWTQLYQSWWPYSAVKLPLHTLAVGIKIEASVVFNYVVVPFFMDRGIVT